MTAQVEWLNPEHLVVLDDNNPEHQLVVHIDDVGPLIDKLTNESERDLDGAYLTIDTEGGASLCLAKANVERGAELEVEDGDGNVVVRSSIINLIELFGAIGSQAAGLFIGDVARDPLRQDQPYSWAHVRWATTAGGSTVTVTEWVGQDTADPDVQYDITVTLTPYECGRMARQATRFGAS